MKLMAYLFVFVEDVAKVVLVDLAVDCGDGAD